MLGPSKSRPKVAHTRSSMYRPMTQMNGDYLTQLRKPVWSELNPDFKGTVRARATHCRQQVAYFYRDQQFQLRRLSRREEMLYSSLIRVANHKRVLRRKHRAEAGSEGHGEGSEISGESRVSVLPQLEGLTISVPENELIAVHKENVHGSLPVININVDNTELMDENQQDELQDSIIDMVHMSNQAQAQDNTNKAHVSFKIPSICDTERSDNRDATLKRRSSLELLDESCTEARDLQSPHDKHDKRRKSVAQIWIDKHDPGSERRKSILDREPPPMYSMDATSGEVSPSVSTFKRRSFALPSNKEGRERKRLLGEIRSGEDSQAQARQRFYTKLEEEKDKQLLWREAGRPQSTDQLVLKEPESAGAVSIERLAAAFQHRHERILPAGVEPDSIQAMRACTYVRGTGSLSAQSWRSGGGGGTSGRGNKKGGRGTRSKMKYQTKHIFQQKPKLAFAFQ